MTEIIDRLWAGETDVTRREIGDEIARFAIAEAADGLKSLFAVYCERVQLKTGEPPEDTTIQCLRGLDLIARMEDFRTNSIVIRDQNGAEVDAYVYSNVDGEGVGPTALFFRETLGYNPPERDPAD